ncbi:cellulase family glycosylhydrolase [Haloarchaeobius sp. TZWSO28]|uniref:cellulase family glycosylhydrolase n=1 Tax=Haloarchaeobius sp. TZWSO28 TaxID=3446119 RepID=UPI003EC0C2CB
MSATDETERRGPHLTADSNRLCLDGDPIDVWGIRTSSSTASDAQCDHLIDQLDEYLEHGVNAVTVFYQGCMGAYYNPFTPDGSELEPDHKERMERIVEACASRDMIVIVGIFYQRAPFTLQDADAVRAAVRRVAEHLRPYGNVILNIANEHSSFRWAEYEAFDFRNPDRILELCRVVHEVDPDLLVGGGGYHPETCAVIGRDPACDVLMFDTGNEDLTGFDSGAMHDRLVRAGVSDTPIVNVELYGGWTGNFPRGVFPAAARRRYENEIDRAAERPGLSVFFHSNTWCQSPSFPMRYDLGGQGTPDNPGIRWFFDRVREVRDRCDADA